MSASLVGSEMCIRDRICAGRTVGRRAPRGSTGSAGASWARARRPRGAGCLLYTSDAADDM
eukprot:8354501-Alexandrium_andersonii.AAC.1